QASFELSSAFRRSAIYRLTLCPDNLNSDLNAPAALLDRRRDAGLKIATAESWTGGLVAVLMTEILRSSAAVERGFVASIERGQAGPAHRPRRRASRPLPRRGPQDRTAKSCARRGQQSDRPCHGGEALLSGRACGESPRQAG